MCSDFVADSSAVSEQLVDDVSGSLEQGSSVVHDGSDSAKPDDGLKIYRATSQEEILNIKDISLEFHSESRYAHLEFSEVKFIRAYTKAISSPEDTLAVYVQYKGETVAVLNAGTGDYYLGVGGKMVTIYVMYVSARIRSSFLGGKIGVKLLRIVSDWAKSQNAKEIHIHSTSGIEAERTDKLLTRMGFRTYGGNYVVKF